MLHLCFAGGLRVSELVGLQMGQLSLQRPPSIRVIGKGRKERSIPLWKETTTDLRAWLAARGPAPYPRGLRQRRRRHDDTGRIRYILDKHTRAAAAECPALVRRSVSPHQLRHSCAVMMLQATRDIRKVALWLSHADVRTTEIYLRLDPSEKLEAMESVLPPALRRGRFKAPDALIASLFNPATPAQVEAASLLAPVCTAVRSASTQEYAEHCATGIQATSGFRRHCSA